MERGPASPAPVDHVSLHRMPPGIRTGPSVLPGLIGSAFPSPPVFPFVHGFTDRFSFAVRV